MARFSPLAPVGGTMCVASPARNSRPYRIGALTKLRIGVIAMSSAGPSFTSQPGSANRSWSACQIRASGQSSARASGSTCRYSLLTCRLRMLYRAKPSGWWA